MPSDDYHTSIITKRSKKDDKAKKTFELNGKLSSKHLRLREQLLTKAAIVNQGKVK